MVGEERGQSAPAAPLGRHHCPHFQDASGQRGALTRPRPSPDPGCAPPTPPCADRTSGALRRSSEQRRGASGTPEAGTGAGRMLGRGSPGRAPGQRGNATCPQTCTPLSLRSGPGGRLWLPRYGRPHNQGKGDAGPVPGRALRAGAGGTQAWGGGAVSSTAGGPAHHRNPLPAALPVAVLASPEPHWMTTAGHCHKAPSVPPEQHGQQRELQVPTQVRPAVEGWGPRQQPHWGAPCARCQKGPDKLWAGKGTEVREQGRLLPAQRQTG